MSRQKIVLLGMMTKIPVAGVVWQTLHYLVGLERLGYEIGAAAPQLPGPLAGTTAVRRTRPGRQRAATGASLGGQ